MWNFAGGVGKSTIAANLAALSARRGYDTLLVSTSAPDTIPITLPGLEPTPNLSDWQSNPTADGLRLLTQKAGSVDVVVGCPDVFSAGRALGIDGNKPGSFKAMMSTAIRDYPVVVVDTPPDAGAATALSTANHLVLVAEPTYPVAMCTVEAYRTVFERMAGMHSLSKANTYLLLNRAASHRVEPGRWHRQTAEHVQGSFLPLIATVPTLPEVGQAQDDAVFPIDRSEPFRRALMPLADALFADTGQRKAKGPGQERLRHQGEVLTMATNQGWNTLLAGQSLSAEDRQAIITQAAENLDDLSLEQVRDRERCARKPFQPSMPLAAAWAAPWLTA